MARPTTLSVLYVQVQNNIHGGSETWTLTSWQSKNTRWRITRLLYANTCRMQLGYFGTRHRLRIEHGLNKHKHERSAESAPLSLMLGMQNIRAEKALLGSSPRGLDLKKDQHGNNSRSRSRSQKVKEWNRAKVLLWASQAGCFVSTYPKKL